MIKFDRTEVSVTFNTYLCYYPLLFFKKTFVGVLYDMEKVLEFFLDFFRL